MYVTELMIHEMAVKYGTPLSIECRYPVDEAERHFIATAHREPSRNHDFTLYVEHPDDRHLYLNECRFLVIAKTVYPPGMYRSMSGGLVPDEPFEVGIAREASEELGCVVKLTKFLLRTDAHFQGPEKAAPWRSFVFLAEYVSGDFAFTDTEEIAEVRWAKLDEFDSFGTLFRNGPKGAMHYRASLHEIIAPLLATSRSNS